MTDCNLNITDNTPVKAALAGNVKRVAEFLTRRGVKTAVRRLNHWTEEFRAERGITPPQRVRAVLFALRRFNPAGAEYLWKWLYSFPDDCDKRIRRVSRSTWIAEVFELIGKFQSALVCDRWTQANAVRFQLAEALTCEVVA